MNDDVSYDIVSRPRRLRTTPAMRRFVAETRLDASDLILPVFVKEGITEPQPLTSMPGVVQHLSLIHISEPTRQCCTSRMPSYA